MLKAIPSSKIVEAVTSGALIKSNQNGFGFLKKFFSFSLLYYNTFASTELIYNSIKSHTQ